MSRYSGILVFVALLPFFFSCGNKEQKEMGPIAFEIVVEGPLFKDALAEGVVTLPFQPQKFGITKSDIAEMSVDNIEVSTDHKDGVAVFENLVFTIMTDNTDSKEVASKKITKNDQKIKIQGLEESTIEGFSETDKFYLEMTGISKVDFEDNLKVKGTISLKMTVK